MPTSNGSTGPCATNGCPNIIGTIWTMYNASPRSGCGPTITSAQIWLWADLPQNSGSPWPRSLPTSGNCYKWGDYQATFPDFLLKDTGPRTPLEVWGLTSADYEERKRTKEAHYNATFGAAW